MNALADTSVGDYVNEYFVSSFQKVGTFRIDRNGNKQGGNVAAYFCTPEGRVLHAIAGKTDAETMLREARWVVSAWKMAELEQATKHPLKLAVFFRRLHVERLRDDYLSGGKWSHSHFPSTTHHGGLDFHGLSNQGKVHAVLATYPTIELRRLYRYVFEDVLNEKVSASPVEID